MTDPAALSPVLEALGEPILVAGRDGRIVYANRAARALLDCGSGGKSLFDAVIGDDAPLRTFLRRSAGSGGALVGAASFRVAGGGEGKVQLEGSALRGGDGHPPDVLLRLRPAGVAQFSVLARKVEELNGEIRRRRKVQASLEEALAQKEVLLAELQHRTKNQAQMLLAMFSSIAAEAEAEETRALFAVAIAKLRAIAAAQQVMYEVRRFDNVSASALVESVAAALAASWPAGVELAVETEDAPLANDVAVPLALVLNELLSNALKHGLGFGSGRVNIDLHRDGAEMILTVSDSGPGFAAGGGSRRMSGLSIVRGLCRQIGGKVDFAPGPGGRVTLMFPAGGTARAAS